MKKIILLISALVCVEATSAQSLTLEMCREMAVENNLKIEIASEQAASADNTMRAMRANFLPKFTASATWFGTTGALDYNIAGGYLPTFVPDLTTGELVPNVMVSNGYVVTGSDGQAVFNQYAYFPGMDIEVTLNSVFTTSLQIEQPIYMGGKISAGYRMSKIGVELAGLNKQLTREQVILECDKAYWDCVRAESMVEALELYCSTLEAFYTDIKNAVEVGMKTTNDELKVQVSLNDAELSLMKARNASSLAKMNLCHVIGLPLTRKVELAPEQSYLAELKYEGFDVSSRVEYQMLDKKIGMSEQNERVIKADFLPNIGAVGMGGYTNGVQVNGETMFNTTSLSGMVSVSIPIFHWGEGRNKLRAQRHASQVLRLEQQDIAEKMQLEVQQAYNSYMEAQQETSFVLSAQKQAEENMRVTKDSYGAGRETLSTLLEAQTLWQKALTNTVDAKARLRIAHTAYLKAIGQLE